MKLVLGKFALNGIEALLGRDLPAGLQTALRHYVKRERPAAALEALERRFLAQTAERGGHHLELALDVDTEEALERRAREYGGITVEQLAAHAVLAYLADRDAQPVASSR
jgi:hypothetical protein